MNLTRYHLELAFAGAVFLVGVVGILGSRELEIVWGARGPGGGFFPFRVSLVLMVAAALVAFFSWRKREALSAIAITDAAGARRIVAFGLPIVALVLLAQWLGLYVAAAIYLFATIHFLARRPLVTALPVALAVPVVAFVVFELWFKVPLLKGPLERLLGLG